VAVVEPLLPKEPPKPKSCTPRVLDRATLADILFVLKTAIPWEMLPQEMGSGSDMICWRRLMEGQELSVWERLHRTLLDHLREADKSDWERASLDSAVAPAPGDENIGPNPMDRGKQASKRYLGVDKGDVPLVVRHSATNVHYSKMLEELVTP
jgi:transposase